ncbi:hypothetical protein N7481_000157 [Penicillium waksmanii]|uniref:uncharacterized protein n=1 Tax=Penicillium waksmanii TaxID=69791 RepID=UPI002547C506|nr:uncharacterized protein N7481_000157 [Penicillium waksmanii]KAJ5999748.1 hypothetical protein N7481_000157 [Penicillium waksmanii]
MDFASLTRPAVICHCRRCFSSLAVLENEWAEVSNFYATSTAWVSVDADRISVSSQRKRIPDHSDASLIRGRITQEASCRMCPNSSKLGVLVEMDNGPIFIWKMSKVSFREVVSMRPTEPVFKEAKEAPRSTRNSFQGGAIIPTGGTDFRSLDPAMQHHMQHQGRSIDQISSSVNNLHDTMADLKLSFNSLRIELNVPTRYGGESSGPGFDMVATVLKELKSKSDEIEKLKLEIEALKLKARIAEDSKPHTPEYMAGLEGALPRMQSPDLLQAGRKRGWADTFSAGNTLAVADTFHEDDMEDDLSITGHIPSDGPHIPLRDLAHDYERRPWSAELGSRDISTNRETRPPQPAQSPAKKQRLTQDPTDSDFIPLKRRPGRPKKSDVPNEKDKNYRGPGRPRRSVVLESDGTADQEIAENLNPHQHYSTPAGYTVIHDSSQFRNETKNGSRFKEDAAVNKQNTPMASIETQSGIDPKANEAADAPNALPTIDAPNGTNTNENIPADDLTAPQTTTENGIGLNGDAAVNDQNAPQEHGARGGQNTLSAPVKTSEKAKTNRNEAASGAKLARAGSGRKKRKASLAARDAMIRNEMQREEAMETEQTR